MVEPVCPVSESAVKLSMCDTVSASVPLSGVFSMSGVEMFVHDDTKIPDSRLGCSPSSSFITDCVDCSLSTLT